MRASSTFMNSRGRRPGWMGSRNSRTALPGFFTKPAGPVQNRPELSATGTPVLLGLDADRTRLDVGVPRTTERSPAKTLSPQQLSALQRRDIHTVIFRGRINAGRKTMQSTTETVANQRKKIVERRKVTATGSVCVVSFALVAAVVKQGHHETGQIFQIFEMQQLQLPRMGPPGGKAF